MSRIRHTNRMHRGEDDSDYTAEHLDFDPAPSSLAATNVQDAIDEVVAGSSLITEITDLPTAETDTSKRLAPDGAGGVEWGTGGSGTGWPTVYTYDDTSNADADPGSGNYRLDDADTELATKVILADIAATGDDLHAWIASWALEGGALLGYLRLRSVSSPGAFATYHVTAVTVHTGYTTVTVDVVAAAGGFATSLGDTAIDFWPAPPLFELFALGVRVFYRKAVLALSPVGYWRLGEPSGTTAVDEMGANNGTYVNTPTLGVSGLLAGDSDTAVTLNGTDEGMSVADAATFDCLEGTNPFTVALWVSHTPDATYRRVWGKVGVGTYGDVMVVSQNALLFFRRVDITASDNVYASQLTAGTHLVVATYSGTSMELFVDGASVGTAASTRSLALDQALKFGIEAGAYFNGTIDEPAVWDRVLSATEIAALYEIGSTG